jgi:dinuclear metal center YbgI/SA1388 family protein
MLIKEITSVIEAFAPLHYQESYDNAGLCIGSPETPVNAALLTIDVTEKVIDEAIAKKCNLVISHHPLIFSGLKKLTGTNYIERCITKAIQKNIAIYSAHTNADAAWNGVNRIIADKLGLKNCKILSPVKNELRKLVTFVPESHAVKLSETLFAAGAGNIGNYDNCSFNTSGNGTFRGDMTTNPYVGEAGKLHIEPEIRIETIFPKHLQNKIIAALYSAHPYEEPAFDIYQLENSFDRIGMGMTGNLEKPLDELEFLQLIKETFHSGCIRYTQLLGKKIKKVAVCGGSGSSMLKDAIKSGADIFITADFKYHQFFDSEKKLVIADIGHYESEQFTKELFYNLLMKNFPTFAVHFSNVNTNPINYL